MSDLQAIEVLFYDPATGEIVQVYSGPEEFADMNKPSWVSGVQKLVLTPGNAARDPSFRVNIVTKALERRRND